MLSKAYFCYCLFCISTVLITVTGKENFDTRGKIIEAKRKGKKKSRGFLLLGHSFTVLCEIKHL